MIDGAGSRYDPVAMLFPPASFARLVVKIGSSLLVAPDGGVRRDWLATIAADLVARRRSGQQLIVVSSGAIALGARQLGLAQGGRATLADAQAAAAAGQIVLAGLWAEMLHAQGVGAAQILLTLGDLEDRRRYLNVAATLARLLGLGVIPVVNENDSVATEEIRFGDNDRLAARVAAAALADAVLLLSDVDGLYDRNPADPAASHLARVEAIDDTVLAMADHRSASAMGSGGMTAKVQAARIATAAGIPLAIASGRHDHPLAGDARHTLFAADRAAPARKAWLAGRASAAGTIHVDAGAARALTGGASLLAAGATQVEGTFRRGDLVAIEGPAGPIARGLSEYDAADAGKLLGRQSDAQAAVLGYAPRAALVHRDHLVLV